MLKIQDSDAYSAARTVTHWAMQFPGTVGRVLADPQDDWGHVSVAWDPAKGLLLSQPAIAPHPFRVGLRVASLELIVESHDKSDTFALVGRTVGEAMTWLGAQVGLANNGDIPEGFEFPFEKMGEHDLASGGVFVGEPALPQVEAWIAMASTVIDGARADLDDPTPMRIWPHHFDGAAIGVIDKDADPEEARSVTMGLSFGDGGSPTPYAYVLPWPAPSPDVLDDLEVGAWTTDGWVGALINGSDLPDDLGEATAMLHAFYAGANVAARKAIGAD
ncbi:hypothetical protein MNBD_ACTINO02-2640 [hydrothermal vent metagenome]|uniref:Uncharacterized protein n=1 Tax=hydrothermal vent metagenome TaxID=652676 RepID=A0A3B0TK99_9ZZZZ